MKNIKLVWLLGAAGSGKDTIGKVFVEKGYKRVSFADIVKEEYAAKINIDVSELHIQGPKKESHRKGIIEFAEGEKLKDPLVWLKKAMSSYQDSNGKFLDGTKIVITDFRRDCEVDWYYDLWEEIKEFEISGTVANPKTHPVDLKLFYINRVEAEENDKDVLTHFTIGKVKGVNKVQSGFIDGIIYNNDVVSSTKNNVLSDKQYKKMKTKMQEKTEKIMYLFDL